MTRPPNRIRALLTLLVLASAVAISTAGYAKDAEEMVVLDPGTLKFTPIPDMPSCASAAILRGDPRSGPAWVLLKLGAGCRVPWHWHTANETLVVISGQGTISMKDGPPLRFVPGAYSSLPSHHAHQASCSRSCLLFNGADAAFDVHYVDEKGDEISSKEALQRAAKTPPKKKTKRTKH